VRVGFHKKIANLSGIHTSASGYDLSFPLAIGCEPGKEIPAHQVLVFF
jgi:hypothetical protein